MMRRPPFPSLAWSLAAAYAVLLLPLPASAQASGPPSAFAADRPGLGVRAPVLAQGVWQAELGGTIRGEVYDEFLVGSALVRTGFAGVEMRLELPSGFVRRGGSFLQFGDLGLGLKVPLALGGAWWRWAALATLTLPVGSREASAGKAGAAGTFTAEVELAGDVTLTMNGGYGFLLDEISGGTASLVLTPRFPVPGRSDLRAYLGGAAFARAGDDDFYVEWGLLRMEGPGRQWDLNAGYDPGSNTWFLGVGLAQRW